MSDTQLSDVRVNAVIDLALEEDLGQGDITTDILVPSDLQGKASFLVKRSGVLAGIEVARIVFLRVDPTLKLDILIKDGARIKRGDIVATVIGSVAGILKGERVALNFLQRLSGTATATARFVARTRGLTASIVDTRKTTPGLRALEKYAVRMGGGKNHRMHLGDAVLIKDNHLAAVRAMGLTMQDAIRKARQKAPPGMVIEAEATTVQEAIDAASAGADMVMFDNMSPAEMKQAIGQLPVKVKTEASGGITLATVRAAAETGVDIISVGALTHSVKALDISLELEPQTLRLL